jgi:hypothetical protein
MVVVDIAKLPVQKRIVAQLCYIDMPGFSGPKPTGSHHEPSLALREDKERFGAVVGRGGSDSRARSLA